MERSCPALGRFAVLTSFFIAPLLADPGSGLTPEESLPLEPARRIELVLDEGTWMSLDVSPDGRHIAFDLLGDLHLLPIDGGTARSLTRGMAFDSQPRWSPDGRRIAFLSDRGGSENLWITRVDGERGALADERQLSADDRALFASPAWTSDGQWVVVSRSLFSLGTWELWMYHVDGGAGVQVTRAKDAEDTPTAERHNALGATASPDGRHLYYATKKGPFGYNLAFPQWQIARRDLASGHEDILTRAPGSAFRPVLSPDGRTLVYGTRHDAETGLRQRDLASGEDAWLLFPVDRDEQESRFTRDLLPGYAFTPDGQALIVGRGGRIERFDLERRTSREIPMRVHAVRELGPALRFPWRVEDTETVRARLIQGTAVDPGGTRIAFSAFARLYTAELGGEPRLHADAGRAFQPAFSADGAWLTWVTWEDGEGHVWRLDLAAPGSGQGPRSPPRRLTRSGAFYTEPVVSPDGSKIVVLRAPAHERRAQPTERQPLAGLDLVWLDAERQGDPHLIVPARGVGQPHFGPQPDRVYVSSAEGLISIQLDGTDRRLHLRAEGPGRHHDPGPVPADETLLRPAGDWALVRLRQQLHLVAVPPVGGEPPVVELAEPAAPLVRLTDVGADEFGWADDGATIFWTVGSTFYRRPFAGGAPQTAAPEAFELTVERPRSRPRGHLALIGAEVITLRGEERLEGATVLIDGHRIAAVGPVDEVDVPSHATRLDATGLVIIPGFVDTHAHWFELRRGVLDVDNWSFLANLAYGVTTGLDVQTSTPDTFAYQDLADAGEIPGPRAFSTGPAVFSDHAFGSLEETVAALRRYRDHYRTHNVKAYLVGNRRQRQWVAQACRELALMPTAEGALDLELGLTYAIDGFAGNEHALPVFPLYRDVVELYARSQIGYTPTLLVSYGGPFAENHFFATEEIHDDAKLRRFVPHAYLDARSRRRPIWAHPDEHVYRRIAAAAAQIVRAGGRVGVGSHGQLQGLGYHWELWALAAGGLTPHQALRAATLGGAEILGADQDLGSIEPGKLADLVVLEANPLDDLRNTTAIRWVLRGGVLYDGDTLDQLWPENQPREPLRDDEPVRAPHLEP